MIQQKSSFPLFYLTGGTVQVAMFAWQRSSFKSPLSAKNRAHVNEWLRHQKPKQVADQGLSESKSLSSLATTKKERHDRNPLPAIY